MDVLARLVMDEQERQEARPQDTPSQESTEGTYLTVQDLADRYHVSPATIYRWAREGRFPKGKYWGPRTRRWKAAELE